MKLSNIHSGCMDVHCLANFSGLCISYNRHYMNPASWGVMNEVLLCVNFDGFYAVTAAAPLQFLTLGVTPGVTRVLLPPLDDGFSSAINITGGFRFGNTNETAVHVSLLLYSMVCLCMKTFMNPTFNLRHGICIHVYKLDMVQ